MLPYYLENDRCQGDSGGHTGSENERICPLGGKACPVPLHQTVHSPIERRAGKQRYGGGDEEYRDGRFVETRHALRIEGQHDGGGKAAHIRVRGET